MTHDPIRHPAHYTAYPVQPIEITRHRGFCLGNVVKYVLRAPHKGGAEDLKKAQRYLELEDEMPFKPIFSDWSQMSKATDAVLKHLIKAPVSDMAALQAQFLLDLKSYSRGIWRDEEHAERKSALAARVGMGNGIHEMIRHLRSNP